MLEGCAARIWRWIWYSRDPPTTSYMACPVQFLCKTVRNVGLVLFYYVFSIGITFYNKWLMKGFHYPLFMTLVHLTIIFLLSTLTRQLMMSWTGKPRVVLGWRVYLVKVAPTG